jgi:hypothetical protein
MRIAPLEQGFNWDENFSDLRGGVMDGKLGGHLLLAGGRSWLLISPEKRRIEVALD